MKTKTKYIICIICTLFLGSLFIDPFMKNGRYDIKKEKQIYNDSISPKLVSSSRDISDIIEDIFNTKVLQYANKGYFPQLYEPSLQATYYAIYILHSIGKLNEINVTENINYILSHYDPSLNRFMDSLSYRYLDTDFTKTYFPLSTILEVTCYAILSLDLLNALDYIDIPGIIDFIWSCYNPNSGGFIGRPYNVALEERFKIATADNTYFAVITLDVLMDDWLGYSTQKNAIISFINGLQNPDGVGWGSGGFNNDEQEDFNSLLFHFEPNLISSYYCIKTLETFSMQSSINDVSFHQFLLHLYDSHDNYFRVSELDFGVNYTNIVATAIGYELANITNFSGFNASETLSFILNNRNSKGNWDQSTTVTIHELIDTYQIIRSLENTEELTHILLEERNQIGNATILYQTYQGFSHLSEDYTSMNLIYSIIESFVYYDRISEVNIQQLYNSIKNSYNNFPSGLVSRYFYAFLRKNTKIGWFRSHPIEYFTSGNNNYIHQITLLCSHQSTYYALRSLEQLFKLDDFAGLYDLTELINDIIKTQFLNGSYYENFGAFSPYLKYSSNISEIINNKIYCDYTYYAIKCLELLGNYLGISLTDTGININAVYTYIDRNLIETPTTLYFYPQYANDVETILKTTYYMTYILKAINLYNKDSQKIKTYIETNLNYLNIKNVYYSYKLSELLSLDIEFDFHQIHNLVQTIYSDDLKNFYLTPEKDGLDQEIFLWICDMARTSQIGIEANYSESCQLGKINHIEVSLYNLILKNFGTYITFKFESTQLGSYIFSKLPNNIYVYDIPIPLSSNNYPRITGWLRAYEGPQVKAEYFISFSTNYTVSHHVKYIYDLSAFYIGINASIFGDYPLSSGYAFAKIYNNGEYKEGITATHQEHLTYSTFTIVYNPQQTGDYVIELYLNDGISKTDKLIASIPYSIQNIIKDYEGEISIAIPIMVIFLVVPGMIIAISTRKIKKEIIHT
ncbi:MAG: hypothetical protein ACFFDF_15940 [Candidatus Odinarchaeota archaeon]